VYYLDGFRRNRYPHTSFDEAAHFLLVEASDDPTALSPFFANSPDIIFLDLMMPGMDGWGVAKQLRAHSNVPIVAFTGVLVDEAVMRALDVGADVIVYKDQLEPQRLAATVNALLRRSRREPYKPSFNIYSDDLLTLDLGAQELRVGGKDTHLMPSKLNVLGKIVENPNRVVSSSEIAQVLFLDSENHEHQRSAVRWHIMRLRRAIEPAHPKRRRILMVRGIGYRYARGDR